MTADAQEFCLRWNNHQSNLVTAFYNLQQDQDFLDVTLACDGRNLQAHKVVLSACSPFFRDILKTTPCKHPVIILRDVSYPDLEALVEFMYQGEVRIAHDVLPSFLRTAEVLRVKGLADNASLRQKALSQQLADAEEHPQEEQINDSHDMSETTAATFPEVSINTEVKQEVMNDFSEAPDYDQNESALNESFEDDAIEDQVTEHPLLTLQRFAQIQSNLPSVVFNGISGEALSETVNHQDLSTITLGTSRDPSSPHECPHCNRIISSLYALRRHIQDRHSMQTSVFPCDLCGRTYRTKNSLSTHRSKKHRYPQAPSPTSVHMTQPQAKEEASE